MINELQGNQVIVVGTNLNGEHYGGAAAQAHQDFGLEWGVAEGLSGKTYAFPTLTKNMKQFLPTMLRDHVSRLYQTARNNPDLEFLLTPVGTGIAGYPYEVIEELFKNLPANINKVGWRNNEIFTKRRVR